MAEPNAIPQSYMRPVRRMVAAIACSAVAMASLAPKSAHAARPSVIDVQKVIGIQKDNAAKLGVAKVGHGLTVEYRLVGAPAYIKTGGSRAWRNNNPGNERYGVETIMQGAIGQDLGHTGADPKHFGGKSPGYAIFPDAATGWNAFKHLLKRSDYADLTIKQAITQFAPATENHPGAYAARVIKSMQATPDGKDIGSSTPMKSLTAGQFDALVNGMSKVEVWAVGTITPLAAQSTPAAPRQSAPGNHGPKPAGKM